MENVIKAWSIDEWLKLAELANRKSFKPQSHRWVFDPYTQEWHYVPIV